MITVISLPNNFVFKIFAVVDSELPSEIEDYLSIGGNQGEERKPNYWNSSCIFLFGCLVFENYTMLHQSQGKAILVSQLQSVLIFL